MKKKKINYSIDYFIKKFKSIPLNKWHVGNFVDKTHTKFCAFGHCGVLDNQATVEADVLEEYFNQIDGIVDRINDGHDKRFQQKHPRTRILAALRLIKKLSDY